MKRQNGYSEISSNMPKANSSVINIGFDIHAKKSNSLGAYHNSNRRAIWNERLRRSLILINDKSLMTKPSPFINSFDVFLNTLLNGGSLTSKLHLNNFSPRSSVDRSKVIREPIMFSGKNNMTLLHISRINISQKLKLIASKKTAFKALLTKRLDKNRKRMVDFRATATNIKVPKLYCNKKASYLEDSLNTSKMQKITANKSYSTKIRKAEVTKDCLFPIIPGSITIKTKDGKEIKY